MQLRRTLHFDLEFWLIHLNVAACNVEMVSSICVGEVFCQESGQEWNRCFAGNWLLDESASMVFDILYYDWPVVRRIVWQNSSHSAFVACSTLTDTIYYG